MTTQTLIQLGEPVEHRGIVLAPLFPRAQPARAVRHPGRGARPRLPGDRGGRRRLRPGGAGREPDRLRVIVYDGEELVGAKQNRILNVTVLVPRAAACGSRSRAWSRGAGAAAPARSRRRDTPPTPSCAGGRPSGSRRRRCGSGPPRTRYGAPSPRSRSGSARTRRPARRRTSSPRAARARRNARRVPARAGAVGRARRARPRPPLPRLPLAAGGLRAPLPEAARRLPARRARAAGREAGAGGRLEAFVEAVLAAPRRREPSVGLGEDVRVSAKGLVGSGLELDGELVQLSAYSTG